MRIEAVTAAAFGPFSGETLQLSPGMNVIYGPNESGKSSWHAALYAALCGMKKTRGQPTREDRLFTAQHRPWRGNRWQVSVALTLDDGRAIEIEQSLGSGGRSVARDRGTKRLLAGDIVRAGAVDAATLLGLTRETALATLFVRQADMLRVLSDAAALQEYLERAAATSAVDTTAEQALARITAYKKEHVGLLRAGSRGPLANATRRLKEAREQLDAAEERFESYQELLARRHAGETAVHDVEQRLREVTTHERERHRQERWVEIRAAERRLEQARELASAVAAGPQDSGPSPDVVSAVNRALAAFDARPSKPEEPQGPTVDELEAQLLQLPEQPLADVEPGEEVTAARDAWHHEQQRLAADSSNQPEAPAHEEEPEQQGATAAEIEAELAALPDHPGGDVEPAQEVAAARDAWHHEQQRLAAHSSNQPEAPAHEEEPEQQGATAAEIEAELAALPDHPGGDVEPAQEVAAAREALHRERLRLAAHDDLKPSPPADAARDIPSHELRRLADELEVPLPLIDPQLRDDVARRHAIAEEAERNRAVPTGQSTSHTASNGRSIGPVTIAGAALAIVGIILVLVGQLLVGGPVLILGVAVGVVGSLRARSPRSSAPASTLQADLRQPDVELQRLESRLLLEEEAVAHVERRHQAANTRIVELGLPLDTSELRRLASARDGSQLAGERVVEWEQRRKEIEGRVAAAEQDLRTILTAHGTSVDDQDDLDESFQRYVETCRHHAQQAAQAARRADLEARLNERRAAETATQTARERVVEWEQRRKEIEGRVAAAEQDLRTILTARGTSVDDQDDLDESFQRYVETCRHHAQQAAQAARRADLEARLNERRAAETATQTARERVVEWEQRRKEIEGRVAAADQDLRTLLTARGTSVDDQDDLDESFQRYVETCRHHAQQAAQAARRADLEARINERRAADASRAHDLEARDAANSGLIEAAASISQTTNEDPETAASTLRDWLATEAQRDQERQQQSERVARLDQLLEGRTLDVVETDTASLRTEAGDPVAEDAPILVDHQAELAALQSQARQQRDSLSELVGQVEVSEKHLLDVSKTIEAEARASSEVARLESLAEDLDVALAILGAAQDKVHADIAPVLNEAIRPWVPRITRGRYDDVRVNPATLEVEAHEVGGTFRAATILSQGTTEQLFLLLRLALAQRLTTTGEKAPIVLDDVTVQSDADRTVAALDLLHELSAEHQVVLFSQEDEVLRWATEKLVDGKDQLVRLPARA